jgi:DNA-binding PadR family transcriptional regulator
MAPGIPRRPKGPVALAALALLAERPLHPYEMQRLLHERRKDYAEGKTRALYRAMEEMEALGWVEPAETTREGRRPERTVFRITPEGREALEDWLADMLERCATEHPAFTVAIGLLPHLPQERALSALQARVVELRASIAAADEAGAALQELRLPRVVLLELEHQRALQEAEMRWVLSLVDDIRTGRLRWSEEILMGQFAAMHEAEALRHTHQGGAHGEPRAHRGPAA